MTCFLVHKLIVSTSHNFVCLKLKVCLHLTFLAHVPSVTTVKVKHCVNGDSVKNGQNR